MGREYPYVERETGYQYVCISEPIEKTEVPKCT